MSNKILFISHPKKQCGVYEFGENIFYALSSSKKYNFIKAECNSMQELNDAVIEHSPIVIIYNYHPSTMPWLCTKISKGVYRNRIARIKAIQIGFIHEATQKVADTATAYQNRYILGDSKLRLNSLFDFYIAADPTLLLKNPLVFKTGRLIPVYNKNSISPAVPTIGSFGFGTPNKGFQNIVSKVENEFDEAIINLNIPYSDFVDNDGTTAKKIASELKTISTKPGIALNITHDYLDNEQLLDFLAKNSMNVFLYEDKEGRGISSAIDYALAVKKPIAVSNCPMFRHILSAKPSVCIDSSSLKTILRNGFQPLQELSKDWNKEGIVWEFERILNAVLSKTHTSPKMGIINTIKSRFRKFFSLPDKTFTWLRNSDKANEDDMKVNRTTLYTSIEIPSDASFNRILDNNARSLYKPAIDKLFELVPKTMSKKIAEANVQQAFVFDTVYKNITKYDQPKMLCVGSYEDTASMALQKLGYRIDEIDPMINYYLQEFYTKPTTIRNSYNIIFSTSVIEHDPDDKSFIECIDGLLAPNGIAIITCDYKDGWKNGEPKPDVDARFYTKYDLEKRLPSYWSDCEMIDNPKWDCLNPDFNYLGKYQYTFATFVFKKKN